MNTAEPKFQPLKTAKTWLWGVLLCALVGLSCFVGGRLSAGAGQAAPQLDAVVLESRLTEISELAAVTYAYTNMAQFQSSNDFYGMKVPFTTKSFILTYDGVIKAGIRLSGTQVDVSNGAVTVTLPRAEILSHEIDEDSLEVFDEKASIFNPFTVGDFTAFQADQKAAMEARALERGLLQEARDKAASAVRQLLSAALPEGCSLEIR